MARCRMDYWALVDYMEGRADETTRARVQSHLTAGCATCQARLDRLTRLLPALQELDLLHTPAPAMDRARAIFRERFRVPVRTPLLARLIFDSRLDSAFADARGEASQALHLLFTTEAFEIDLWEEQVREGIWYLIGQVLLKDHSGAITPLSATLTASGGPVLLATVEADGETAEFHVSDVPVGVYQLSLHLNEAEILIPDVTVGP